MKNERQLVLFLKKGNEFNPTNLASSIYNKFNQLGDPIILQPNQNDPNQPLIIFNRGVFGLNINHNDISFVMFEENYKKYFDLVIEIMSFLEDEDLSFVRMGYISTFLSDEKTREKFKNNMFKDPEIMKNDFQLSWYSKEHIDSVLVNVWEKHLTDFYNKVDFVSIFDINTPLDEEYNITSSFVDNFLKKCDKFVESRLSDRL